METIKHQKHSKETFQFAASRMLERASFYGLRALLVLYMLSETIKMDRTEALTIYGWFTSSFIFSQVIGALLGDLVIGNKKSIIIGGIIQALGAFSMATSSLTGFYIGVFLVSLGSGLFIPNLLSNFGKSYLKKTKLLDSGFTIFYLAINVGAAFGVFSVGYIGEHYGWNFGFMAAGILMLMSLIPIQYLKENSQETSYNKQINRKHRVVYILFTILLVGLFWTLNEVENLSLMPLQNKLSGITNLNIPKSMWSSLDTIFTFPISILAIFYWSYYYSNQFVKLTIGFLFGALSFALVLLIPENPTSNSLFLYVLALLSLGISEIHISPIMNSILTKYANPKYLAIFMSLVIIPFRLLFLLIPVFSHLINTNPTFALQIGLITMITLGFALIVFLRWKTNIDSTENILPNND